MVKPLFPCPPFCTRLLIAIKQQQEEKEKQQLQPFQLHQQSQQQQPKGRRNSLMSQDTYS